MTTTTVWHPDPFQRITKLFSHKFDARYLLVSMTPVRVVDATIVLFDEFADAGVPVIPGYFLIDSYVASATVGKFTDSLPGPGGSVVLHANTVLDGAGNTQLAVSSRLTAGTVPLPTTFSNGEDGFGAVDFGGGWEAMSGSDVSIPGLGAGFKSGTPVLHVKGAPFLLPKDKYNPLYPSLPGPGLRERAGFLESTFTNYGTLAVAPSGIVYDEHSYTVIGAKVKDFTPHIGAQASFICERND